jgi:homoserine kinase type II
MPRLAAASVELLHSVLERFAVAATSIHDIRSGRVNKHWRIVAGDRVYALRRYNSRRAPAAIDYEHVVLNHLACAGWPVAAPLPAATGRTMIEVAGRRYALFPFLSGRPAPYGNARYLQIKGRLLARLHRDLAGAPVSGQRPGFGHTWDLDAYVRDDRFTTFDELLTAFGREQPELAAAVRTERERNLRELERAAGQDLPCAPIHFDFHHDNILFGRGRLTGLLDFDLVHLDLCMADVASSIELDCLKPPAYDAIDPAAMRAFLSGYLAETRLSTEELGLIVPLLRAQILWLVGFRLAEWATGATEKARRSIARSATRRLPSLDRRAPALTAAVIAAAAGIGVLPPHGRTPGRETEHAS